MANGTAFCKSSADALNYKMYDLLINNYSVYKVLNTISILSSHKEQSEKKVSVTMKEMLRGAAALLDCI